MALRVVAQPVDQCREIALEDHREIAAYCIDLADAQQLRAKAAHRQYLPVRRYRSEPFIRTAEEVRAAVEADEDVAGVHRLEQALLEQCRGHPDQPQRVPLEAAVVAGNVEHADEAAVRAENRAGAAGQETIAAQEVLRAEDGDGVLFGQRRTDGVGPALDFIP